VCRSLDLETTINSNLIHVLLNHNDGGIQRVCVFRWDTYKRKTHRRSSWTELCYESSYSHSYTTICRIHNYNDMCMH